MRIGIDLMGGDSPPEHLFEAVVRAAKTLGSAVKLFPIATPPIIQSLAPKAPPSITFCSAADVITMEDSPLAVVRKKKEASLLVGIRLLKDKKIDAFISCGNTGALIAAASLYLSRLPGIKTTALLAVLPTEKNPLAVLDVGGNLSNSSTHLFELALMGAAYQRRVLRKEKPHVGLLNIGIESKKGTIAHREAYEMLKKETSFEFVGNIEAREVFKGGLDVLVTDGFTGNILLKTSEGVGAFIFEALKSTFGGQMPESIVQMQKRFNYEEYPGALVYGIDGIVIKAHGNASALSLYQSIIFAESQIHL